MGPCDATVRECNPNTLVATIRTIPPVAATAAIPPAAAAALAFVGLVSQLERPGLRLNAAGWDEAEQGLVVPIVVDLRQGEGDFLCLKL